jgi:hypothetical protein
VSSSTIIGDGFFTSRPGHERPDRLGRPVDGIDFAEKRQHGGQMIWIGRLQWSEKPDRAATRFYGGRPREVFAQQSDQEVAG